MVDDKINTVIVSDALTPVDESLRSVIASDSSASLWGKGARSLFEISSRGTSDGIFSLGDTRLACMVDQASAPGLSLSSTVLYRTGETSTVWDSDLGNGARKYGQNLFGFETCSCASDVTYPLFVR